MENGDTVPGPQLVSLLAHARDGPDSAKPGHKFVNTAGVIQWHIGGLWWRLFTEPRSRLTSISSTVGFQSRL
jgi:hypothetical protein